MVAPPDRRLLDALSAALGDGRFRKLVLAGGVDPDPRRVAYRPVRLRAGERVQEVAHDGRTDRTSNLPLGAMLERVAGLLPAYRHADLFLSDRTVHYEVRAGRARLREAAAAPVSADKSHDRRAKRALDPATPWLVALGATEPSGRPIPAMAHKLAQVQRFSELLAHALDGLSRDAPLRLVDLGCGKGWLAFAARATLDRLGFTDAAVRGVDRRADLIEAADRIGVPGVSFQAGAIGDVDLAGTDVVVALHACDTATDDALAAAVGASAARVLVSPCCHRELRPAMRPPAGMASAFRHGIFVERHAEWLTDALRAALLGAAGYRVTVAEFVPTEHTQRNLLLTGARSPGVDRAARAEEARDLARSAGVTNQRLADLLDIALT